MPSVRIALLCHLLQSCAAAAQDHNEDAGNDVMLLQSSISMGGSSSRQPTHLNTNLPKIEVNLDELPERRFRNLTRYYVDAGVYPRILTERTVPKEALQRMAYTVIDDEHKREKLGMLADMGLDESYLVHLLLADLGDDAEGLEEYRGGLLNGPHIFRNARAARFETACTGLLAAMPNGTVVHGRSMDWTGFKINTGSRTLYYNDLIVEVRFMRGGQPLFVSTHWPLHTGIHTAMRVGEHAWSYEQNTRTHFLGTSILSGLYQGTQGLMLAARKIMESTPDFESAVQQFQALRLISPHYIVVAGSAPYEGVVITADRDGFSGPRLRRLGSGTNRLTLARRTGTIDDAVYTGWHVVQTNDDLGGLPMDLRRPIENILLASASQEAVSPTWVLQRMSSYPLMRNHTMFTSVFVPQTGYRSTIVYMDNHA